MKNQEAAQRALAESVIINKIEVHQVVHPEKGELIIITEDGDIPPLDAVKILEAAKLDYFMSAYRFSVEANEEDFE